MLPSPHFNCPAAAVGWWLPSRTLQVYAGTGQPNSNCPAENREHLEKYNFCLIRTFNRPSLSSNKSKKGKKCTMKITFLVIDFKQYV